MHKILKWPDLGTESSCVKQITMDMQTNKLIMNKIMI